MYLIDMYDKVICDVVASASLCVSGWFVYRVRVLFVVSKELTFAWDRGRHYLILIIYCFFEDKCTHSGIGTIKITHNRAELGGSNSQACSLVSVVNNSKTAHCRSSKWTTLLFADHSSHISRVYGLRVDNLTGAQRSTEHGWNESAMKVSICWALFWQFCNCRLPSKKKDRRSENSPELTMVFDICVVHEIKPYK